MKKVKTILLFIQVLLFSQSLFAAPIDDKTALEIANKFLFDNNKKVLRDYEHHILTSSQLYVINYSPMRIVCPHPYWHSPKKAE